MHDDNCHCFVSESDDDFVMHVYDCKAGAHSNPDVSALVSDDECVTPPDILSSDSDSDEPGSPPLETSTRSPPAPALPVADEGNIGVSRPPSPSRESSPDFTVTPGIYGRPPTSLQDSVRERVSSFRSVSHDHADLFSKVDEMYEELHSIQEVEGAYLPIRRFLRGPIGRTRRPIGRARSDKV